MVAQTLQDILETEKSIQEMLKAERTKASAWIEEQKHLIATQLQEQLQSLENADCIEKEKVRKETETLSGQLLEKARQRAKLVKGIPDSTLQTILRKHLQRILPEKT